MKCTILEKYYACASARGSTESRPCFTVDKHVSVHGDKKVHYLRCWKAIMGWTIKVEE